LCLCSGCDAQSDRQESGNHRSYQSFS